MKIPSLRAEQRRPCILRILEASKNQTFQIWQPQVQKRINGLDREVFDFRLQQISSVFRSAKFISTKHHNWRIHHEQPIYFFQSKTYLIFKGIITYLSGREVGIDFPEEVKCRDNRKNLRTKFHINQNKIGTHEKTITFKSMHGDKNKSFTRAVIDQSKNGMSVLINPEEIKLFYPKDRVNIVQNDGTSTEAKIRYVDKVFNGRFYSSTNYRVGMEFLN